MSHADPKTLLRVLSMLELVLLICLNVASAMAGMITSQSPHIPPPPSLSVPVWSLAVSTRDWARKLGSDEVDDIPLKLPETSMNIVTFATAVSVEAPKLWVVSLYHDTLTKDSFLATGQGVLQLLRPDQQRLVTVLGKRTGYDTGYSKRRGCGMLGFEWVESLVERLDETTDENVTVPHQVLSGCALYVHIQVCSTIPAGDHVVALCEVTGTSCWDKVRRCVRRNHGEDNPMKALDPSLALYTGQLRQEGLL